jgi:hypothetical protein
MAYGPENETFKIESIDDLLKGLGAVSRLITLTLIPKALFKAWGKLLAYAIKEEPRVPHKQGRLWASETIGTCVISQDRIEQDGGFNTEYAARLHEAPDGWDWTLEGSGPKYLETKLARHKDDSMKIIADYVLENGGR